MRATKTGPGWQRDAVVGLALLSVVLPLAVIFLERQTITVIYLGLASAVAALVGARLLPRSSARTLSLILVLLGAVLNVYLLLLLIGLCGLGALGGTCQP